MKKTLLNALQCTCQGTMISAFTALLIMVFLVILLSGCEHTDTEDRLKPSGETILVPQGKQFCSDNQGDLLCIG